MNTLAGLRVLTFIFILMAGCRSANDSDKLAEVDGIAIGRPELYRTGGKQLQDLRQQLFQIERQKLDEYIGATLLTREAKNHGLSVATLLDREVNNKVAAVSEDEIRDFYEKNKERIRLDLEKVHDRIRDFLRDQKTTQRKNEYLKSLRAKANVKTFLTPPPISRVEVSINEAPFKGSDKASVRLVKFEDFQCPYCKMVQPRFGELLKKYEGKLKIIHKDLPLDAIHPQARLAAEAARCAGDQGKFWEFHDRAYQGSPKVTADDLKAYAKDVGLNEASFTSCITSGKFKSAVQKDLIEGSNLGLTGTPSFFINGRELSGAQPLEAFTTIIDEELALAK